MQYWRVLIDRWGAEEGQAIVELGVLLPLLALMLLGTIDFARVFYTAMTVTHAARAGVQYGAQSNDASQDTAGMEQAARDAAQDLDSNSLTVTAESYCQCANKTKVDCVTGVCPEGSPPIYITVTAQTTFQTLVNYPGIPHTINVNRTATMRVQ